MPVRRKSSAPLVYGFIGIVALIGCIVVAIVLADEFRGWRARRELDAAKKEIDRSFNELEKSLEKAHTQPEDEDREERYVPPQY